MTAGALFDDAALARFKQAALIGTGPGGGARLKDLAWLAARSRFARPPPPAFSGDRMWPEDERTIVPEAVRPLLISLLAGKDARPGGPLACQTGRELRRRNLRLHPFDLKRLEGFVEQQAVNLGRLALAWIGRVRPSLEIADSYDEVDDMSERGFATAPRAQKIAHVRALRRNDPAAARALVEARFGDEPANVRAGLLGALAIGLGTDDQSFLEGLAEDRAQSVREAAAGLLAQVPGTEPYEKRKADAIGWIEAKTAGLLRRTTTLVVRKTSLPGERLDAVLQTAFEGVTLADMARPFQMPLDTFVAATAGDWRLARLVLVRAAQEGRADLVGRLMDALDGRAPDDLIWAVAPSAFPMLPPAQRETMAGTLLRPTDWAALPSGYVFEVLHTNLVGPLPDATIAALMRSDAWAKALGSWAGGEDRTAADTLETIAALVPAGHSPAFLAAIGPLPLAVARRAALYHRCLLALDGTPPGDPR